MPDDFALWKAAQNAKKNAHEKRAEAERLKKKRDAAWDDYTMAYNAWVAWGKGDDGPDRQKWIDNLEHERKKWDEAEKEWEKARDAATDAERDAIKAIDDFNRALPPDVPLMPIPEEF